MLKRFKKYQTQTKWITIVMLMVAVMVRGYRWLEVPASLYWEEAALAYDGWSIAETGRDMHGERWPLLAFTSFGDYKPSGYFYAVAAGMKVWGAQDWVVRLPSLVAGVMIVYLIGCWMRYVGYASGGEREARWWGGVAMAIAAVNPALIHLSRAGWETNLAMAMFLGGTYLLLPAFRRKNAARDWRMSQNDLWRSAKMLHVIRKLPFLTKFGQMWRAINWRWLGGEILLLLAWYTYHSMRMIAPIAGMGLMAINCWWGWRRAGNKGARKTWKWWAGNLGLMAVVAVMGMRPLWQEGAMAALTNRLGGTAVGADFSLIRRSADCRMEGGNTWWARWWCHRWLVYGREVLKHMGDHLNLDYLFLTGDENGRHSSGLYGVFYPWEVALMALGVVWCWRGRRSKYGWWVVGMGVGWWLIGVLPAGLTEATPHLLRSLVAVPLLIMLVTCGWRELGAEMRGKWWRYAVVGGVGLYMVSWGLWFYHYNNYYRVAKSDWWQYGYREAITVLARMQQEYPLLPVYITRELGRPSIYYFWYNKIPPQQVQARAKAEKMDQGEFLTYTPDGVSFGGGLVAGERLVVLTPAEEQQWQEDELVASRAAELAPRVEVKNLADEVVLIVGKTYDQIDEKMGN